MVKRIKPLAIIEVGGKCAEVVEFINATDLPLYDGTFRVTSEHLTYALAVMPDGALVMVCHEGYLDTPVGWDFSGAMGAAAFG